MSLRPRGRHRGWAPAPVADSSSAPPLLAVPSEAIRTALALLKESTDVFPPLKSAVGGVLAVWDLADRISASDENAQLLAWRLVGILDTIYNAVTAEASAISPGMLQDILKFEELLREISTAMAAQLKPGRFRRVLRLRKDESRLARFTSRLDAASEAFKIRSSTRVELTMQKMQADFSSTASVIEHTNVAVEKIQALTSVLEQANIRLRGEVHVLRSIVLFGISPVFLRYRERECVHGASSFNVHLEESFDLLQGLQHMEDPVVL
ncbi:hypothetical protein B0H13DRAFT_2275335 [Mycena leptocephala]|nr:hypothetical protein B0H13DRAFT_2275335 [Mycena leptocephala]